MGQTTAEHIKLTDPSILELLTCIINRVMIEGEFPDCTKEGVITPIHKKSKPASEPDNYRQITVSSIIGKIIVKEILHQTQDINEEEKS